MMDEQKDQESAEMVQSVIPPAAAPGIGQAQANIQAMQQQAQGEAPAGPGAPAQPGAPMDPAAAGGTPMPFNTNQSQSASVDQLMVDAQQMAQQLYSMPEAERRRQLVNLKQNNPQMHAFVKQFMQDMRQQVASDAVAQSQQPQG